MSVSRLDNQDPALFGQTPWQTVGPYFHYGLAWKGGADLVGDSDIGARTDLIPPGHYLLATPRSREHAAADVIEITGRVFDGADAPIPDAMIEIWQADPNGRYNSPMDPRGAKANDRAFIGFGRASTTEDGNYLFRTLRPGAVPGPDGSMQAPHIAIGLMGRGLLKRLVTRLYFADAPENVSDPILGLVPSHRRETLIATLDRVSPESAKVWHLDIRIQGSRETVFFDS